MIAGHDFLVKPLELHRVMFGVREATALGRLRSRELRRPPFLVRLYHDGGLDLHDSSWVGRLEKGAAEIFVRRKRVEVTTNTLRLLVRSMSAPELPVTERELRPLFARSSTAPRRVRATGSRTGGKRASLRDADYDALKPITLRRRRRSLALAGVPRAAVSMPRNLKVMV